MAAGAVVWEWQNEFGSWRPYSPQISVFLEDNKNSKVPLPIGMVDPILYLYRVDVQNLCQTRQGTGKQRPVRRTVLPSSSPLAQGITWQWEGDAQGSWCDFDIEIIEFLEDCFNKGPYFIDLSKSHFMLPYHIDLKAMTQKRIETGRVRNIQRVFTASPYPKPQSTSSQSSGTKRSATTGATGGAVGLNKKSRTSASVASASTSTVSAASMPPSLNSSGFNLVSGPNFSMTSSGNLYPPLMNGLGSASMLPNPHIFQHQGPITRRRYNQTVSSFSQLNQVQAPVSSSQPSLSISSTSPFNLIPSQNSSAPQTISPFMSFTNIHHHQGSSNMGGVTMFGGGPGGGPVFGFQPSSSNMQLPHNPVQSTAFKARIKPSATQGACASVPTTPFPLRKYDRFPNFTHKSSRKNNNKTADKSTLSNYADILDNPPADDDCCICCEKLIEASGHGEGTADDHIVYKLDRCSHMFHKLCLTAMFESGAKDGHLQCPTCKTIYGEKVGNCPKGEMEYKLIDTELAGYEGCQTIQVIYHIHGGTQGPEHPHPGRKYSARGFPRVGYIPDCDKGRKVLQLLILAWKRRLTFTIGSSTTTGEDNTVTWNEIHHKTELGSNFSGHGYPDPNYLDNVLLELAIHGLTENDIPASS